VADTPRDLEAARAAGCKPHLVCTGRAAQAGEPQLAQWVSDFPGTVVHADLAAFAQYLLRQDAPQTLSQA
jgi:D-glycero-D-manno-heptose 1,7-bisphosphate phosphatase